MHARVLAALDGEIETRSNAMLLRARAEFVARRFYCIGHPVPRRALEIT